MSSLLRRLLTVAALAAITALPAAATEPAPWPATLAGHAVLPAATFIAPPADAPASVRISGKFTSAARNQQVGSVPAMSSLSDPGAPRPTGLALPFDGQPVQGFSGLVALGGNRFLALSDNGFGGKANSPDALLMLHAIEIDWASGQVRRVESIVLRDPERRVPFPIALEGSDSRYLTGADFDPESLQRVGDTLWIGEEFGPFLLAFDRQGRLLRIVETQADGKALRSPDNPAVRTPATPGPVSFEVRRSGGFEGLAKRPDAAFLYAVLERPLWDAQAGGPETVGGREVARILEFDVTAAGWTGRSWRYPFAAAGNAIGDFILLDDRRGLIIERDRGEGSAALACDGPPQPDCFNNPARFKRIFAVDLERSDAAGVLLKPAGIDLLNIADPDARARTGSDGGRFGFPFLTIESLAMLEDGRLVVGNDNNLPFSSGRALGRADDSEFMLLQLSTPPTAN